MDDRYRRSYGEKDITVFWDIDHCKISNGKNIGEVAENVKKALRDSNHTGKVSMMAYGDTSLIKDELESAEIEPIHVPIGEDNKNYTKAELLLSLWGWVIDHRDERSNILLILGDMSQRSEFTRCVFSLKMRNFNILLSQPPFPTPKGALLAAGSKIWFWSCLADGGAPIPETQLSELRSQDVLVDFVLP